MQAPAAHLSTKRLSLTPLTPKDETAVTKLLGDAQVRRYLGGPVPQDQRAARFQTYLKGAPGVGIWAIRLADQADAIGLILLAPHHNGTDQEVSYELDPAFWGKGFGGEAVLAVITHALGTLGLPRVVAETQIANTASCRLLTRLGLQEIQRLERFGALQAIYATPPKD